MIHCALPAQDCYPVVQQTALEVMKRLNHIIQLDVSHKASSHTLLLVDILTPGLEGVHCCIVVLTSQASHANPCIMQCFIQRVGCPSPISPAQVCPLKLYRLCHILCTRKCRPFRGRAFRVQEHRCYPSPSSIDCSCPWIEGGSRV